MYEHEVGVKCRSRMKQVGGSKKEAAKHIYTNHSRRKAAFSNVLQGRVGVRDSTGRGQREAGRRDLEQSCLNGVRSRSKK